MPGPVTPNMSLQLPALGGDSGTWDSEVNNAFTSVDSHTHEPGKGVLVPTAGLNINADLTFAGNGITNLKSLAFSEIAALAAGSDVIFVNSSDHELYWRSHSGVNVKLTSGNALNVAAFAGGIGGDYSAVGAALDYDAANTRYTFQGASPTFDWAALASGDLHLYQEGTTESVYVGLKAPDALAASYSITMPLAAPSNTRPVYMDSGGALSTEAGMTRLGRQTFTGSGTYTPTTGTRAVLLRMVAGGGGGGGAAGGTGSSAGGGGASGVFGEKWISSATALTGGTVTIGAAGTGGANTGADGGTGGDTTVVINGITYIVKGGGGGSGDTAAAQGVALGGSWNILDHNDGDYTTGEPGGVGNNMGGNNFTVIGGAGGASFFGRGTPAVATKTASSVAGNSAIAPGSGGGGAVMIGSQGTGAAGGNGGGGLVIIDEFM